MKKIKQLLIIYIIILTFIFTSCSDADVASHNLSQAADQFEIYRRVVFYNGITDTYILSIEGYCSIYEFDGQLEVTVKTNDGHYLKHFLGLSDNVTYFAEQIESTNVSSNRYRVIFKPSVIIHEIDVR